jgi:hypothetical protein
VDQFDASEPPRRHAVRGRVPDVPAATQTPWLHGKVIASYDVMQKTVAATVDDELAAAIDPAAVHTVRNMYSFLTEYFSSVVLVLHAFRCRAAQAG